MLRLQDLGAIRARVRGQEGFFLQRLVARCILQFQSSKSIDRANALLNSSLDLMQHEVDNKYSTLRYLVWVIPTIGFIGTVVGIAASLNQAGAADDYQDPALLGELHPEPRRGVLHHDAGADAVGDARSGPERRAGARGRRAEPGRPVLPRQPDQPTLREVKETTMPVFRTPDGRIVEEKTGVSPPEDGGANDGRAADGGVSVRGRADRETYGRRSGAGRRAPRGPDTRTRRSSVGQVRRRTNRRRPGAPRAAAMSERASPGQFRAERPEPRRSMPWPAGSSSWRVQARDGICGVGVGRNTLGRDQGNRIALPFGDTQISRTVHLWINYDHLSRAFSVTPGNSSNLAHMNGAAIEERMALADGAMIMIGRTGLRFVAFCGDRFDWSDAG